MNEARWEELVSQTNRERLHLYLQRWIKDPLFLPKLARTGHGAARRQVVWIGGGISVEDLPTMLTGRPQPEPQRDLDTYILPNPAVSTPEPNSPPICWPSSKPGCSACAGQHLGNSTSISGWRTPSSTYSFLHRLPTTESRERGGKSLPPRPLPTPPQLRGKSSGQGVVLKLEGVASSLDLDLCYVRYTFAPSASQVQNTPQILDVTLGL